MESNQNSNDIFLEIVNRNEKFSSSENLNYLYPNGHRMTNQMKWFKGALEDGFRSDKAA